MLSLTVLAGLLLLQPFFDRIHQHAGNGHRERRFDFTNTGWAGDVNFCQTIANDVEADEDQPFGF